MNQYGGYPTNQQNVQMSPYYNPQAGYPGGGYPNYPQNSSTPQASQAAGANVAGMLPMEESYIENILRLNRGKVATVYMTFENNDRWNAKVFKGIIEAAGRDHIILSDPETERRYILLMVYLDYITFDEEIAYEYPYNQALTSYSPR